MRGADVEDVTIEEEVGFLLMADFLVAIRQFRTAYIKEK